jgi:hypothetical protein
MTIYCQNNLERMGGLVRLVPTITEGNGKTALYVGAMPTRQDFLDALIAWGWKVTIIEQFAPYLPELRQIEGVEDVLCGLIQDYIGPTFDMVFWWHGPEHMGYTAAGELLRKLATEHGLVVTGCPRGHTGSGDSDGNELNRHISAWQVSCFEALGYRANVTGTDIENITAVSR